MPQPFRMAIATLEPFGEKSTLVHGPVEHGTVRVGDTVTVAGTATSGTVSAVTVNGKLLDVAHAGETAGVMLRGVPPGAVAVGAVLVGA